MRNRFPTVGLGFCALALSAHARSISVNLTPWPVADAQIVDSDESSFVGIAGAETVTGAKWNEIDLRGAGTAGTPTIFTSATQGGNHIDLIDSDGGDSGVDLTSSGSFYANFANVSAPNQSSTGDAGVMQGFLNLSDTESITLSGLNSWAPSGCQVIAVFDIGPVTRAYAITIGDGALSQTFWTNDTAGTDADPDNDGVMNWIGTTATTSGGAVTDANHAIYGSFTGDTLTISGSNDGGRATLCAFQIVALEAEPSAALNLNFGISLNDANAVDAGESSVVGLPGAATHDGSAWNNLLLRSSGLGAPTAFTSATQGGSHIDLIDTTGADSGINLTSTGSFYSNFTDVTSPDASTTGDAGLMQSILLLNDSESVDLTGLAAWAPNGYHVRAFFDIGPSTRTYGLTMSDGASSQSRWTADTASTDADPDDDGLMTWIETTAEAQVAAPADANQALFGPFTGDALTISGESPEGRAALSGLQIVPLTEPTAQIISFTASPETYSAGETVNLTWEVADAEEVTLEPGIGTVSATGTLDLTPTETTTWTLRATRGGTVITAHATASLSKGPITVYLLGGQSNMQGIALSSKLPDELRSIPEVMLYAAGSGTSSAIARRWVDLQPSGGSEFGPEIGFGERLADLCQGEPLAMIKYAASGTSLQVKWYPGTDASDTGNWGPEFTAFVNTVNQGITTLENDGWQPEIHGMCWQQGEQDAKDGLNTNGDGDSTSADDYGANLAHLIARIREQFAGHAAAEGIRFVPGQVLPYAPAGGDVDTRFPGRDLVRQAILDAAEDSGAPLAVANTRSVATTEATHPTHAQDGDGYRDTDEVHLNDVGQLQLGRDMAYAMLDLHPQSYADWAASHGVVGGPGDDDDHDGVSNRLEYETGGDPTAGTDAAAPRLEEENDELVFSFTRNLEAIEGGLDIHFSPDLADWSSLFPELLSYIRQPDGTALLRYRAPRENGVSELPAGFFRLSHPSS